MRPAVTAAEADRGLWAGVGAELDRWADAGSTVQLWLRDDDAIEPTAQLDRLIALSERFGAPVLLAVIPMRATPTLAHRLAAASSLRPCQHGFRHTNHALADKKAEFGPQRPTETMLEELAGGLTRLRAMFGRRAIPVFVPPWNRIDPPLVAHLPALGFRGLSLFRTMALPSAEGLVTVNSELDVIDWKGGRVGRPHDQLVQELGAWLRAKRSGGARTIPLGVLTHHLVHDDTVWEFLTALLSVMGSHPAVKIADPAVLFA